MPSRTWVILELILVTQIYLFIVTPLWDLTKYMGINVTYGMQGTCFLNENKNPRQNSLRTDFYKYAQSRCRQQKATIFVTGFWHLLAEMGKTWRSREKKLLQLKSKLEEWGNKISRGDWGDVWTEDRLREGKAFKSPWPLIPPLQQKDFWVTGCESQHSHLEAIWPWELPLLFQP